MKLYTISSCFIFFTFLFSAFGQNISETNISLGINRTTIPSSYNYWEEPSPTYLFLGATKCWYGNSHLLSLRKEFGLKLQYSGIHNSSGGLGGSDEYSGKVMSLFVEASLQARLRLNNSFAFALGPEVEILSLGNTNINHSYYSMINYPELSSGSERMIGINRNYFNQPQYGIKLSLFQAGLNDRTTIGLNLSYLWTKSELSDFYASNYTKISLSIGFKKQKKELPPDTTN